MGQVENEGARRRRARIRKMAFVTAIAALAIAAALLALYLVPLCARYAEGPSAENAVEWADRGAGGEYAFSLEREYVDEEGRTVYRLVSGSEPVVVMEARYGFRWLPDLWWSPSVVPGCIVLDPGPYYELANEDEWRRSYIEWDSEQRCRQGRDWLSLHPQKRRETEAAEAEGASVEEGPARETAGRVASKYAARGYDVHVTGRSLGGYLAQVGAAELLGTPWAGRLRAVEYFNGIGLDYAYWANVAGFQSLDRVALLAYSLTGGRLVGHRIHGDPASLLGHHAGEVRAHPVERACVDNHLDVEGPGLDPAGLGITAFLSALTGSSETATVGILNGIQGVGLVWAVHETDSFFYAIGRG